jgi:Spy/CpxP family protein refolding chaperone
MRPLFALTLAALLAPAGLVGQGPPQGPPPVAPRRDAPMRMQRPRGLQAFHGAEFGASAFAPRFLLNRRERLALSDEQAKQLEVLATEMEQGRDTVAADAQAHREKMRALWAADRIDVNALQTEARAGMQAAQAAELQVITSTAKAKALLTAAQRGRVEGWADSRQWGMRQRGMRQFGRGRGPAGPVGGGPQPGMGMRGRLRRF